MTVPPDSPVPPDAPAPLPPHLAPPATPAPSAAYGIAPIVVSAAPAPAPRTDPDPQWTSFLPQSSSPYDGSTPYLKAETSPLRKLAMVAVILFGVAAVIVGIVVAVIATRPTKATLAARAAASASAAAQNHVFGNAADAAKAAFAALETGKVANVTPLIQSDPDPGGLITDAVLTQAVAGSHPLGNVAVGTPTVSGDEASVPVTYTLGTLPESGSVTVDYTYTNNGNRTWKVQRLAGELIDASSGPLDVATVDGVKIDDYADAFPGWYDVVFSDSRGLVGSDTQGVALAPTQNLQATASGTLTLTAAGQQQAQTAIAGALQSCAQETDPYNSGCPFTVPAQDQTYAQTATYTIQGDPTSTIAYHYNAQQDDAVGVGTVKVKVGWTEISVNDYTGEQKTLKMSKTVLASYTAEVGLTGDPDAKPDVNFTKSSQKAAS